jgi:hypothetical protein
MSTVNEDERLEDQYIANDFEERGHGLIEVRLLSRNVPVRTNIEQNQGNLSQDGR